MMPVVVIVLLIVLFGSFFYKKNTQQASTTDSTNYKEVNVLKSQGAEITLIQKKLTQLMNEQGYLAENVNDDDLETVTKTVDGIKERLNKKEETKNISEKNLEKIQEEIEEAALKIRQIRNKKDLQEIINKLFVGNETAIKGEKINASLPVKASIVSSKIEKINNQVTNLKVADQWKKSIDHILENASSQIKLATQIQSNLNKFYDSEGNIDKTADFSTLAEVEQSLEQVKNTEQKKSFSEKIEKIKVVQAEVAKEEEAKKQAEEAKKQQEAQQQAAEEAKKQAEEAKKQQEAQQAAEEAARQQQEAQQKAQEEYQRQLAEQQKLEEYQRQLEAYQKQLEEYHKQLEEQQNMN
ncbi:hypothetical protein F6X86_13715 [Enterococcus durans]|uniref:Uncharacterized protein n=2 Tax=Enterococcus durans TaxID=53345 RepID=A0A5N0YNR6_9ENTE|nr:hypothetical protein [Enterococcus durans]KAA9176656.1 hypothetical protein F6X86_13715 [Enterococcus durans]KAA9190031.1 hypothetical protein F6X88_13855 [Enterococcus durans]KAA9197229.1 hypothetical protein F6X91_12745 [Enterococcus durans]KAA9203376.1 hypothetical protein F6X95_13740 [Enterococcus durans]KAA9212462.1 hypothetical protein F6X97_14070 [Enterococcus durans]